MQVIKWSTKFLMMQFLILTALLTCLPPITWVQKKYQLIYKSTDAEYLAQKQLVTVGLISDCLYEIVVLMPIFYVYRKPQALLEFRWQHRFNFIMDRIDDFRVALFCILYLTIDLISYIYKKYDFFEDQILQKSEK